MRTGSQPNIQIRSADQLPNSGPDNSTIGSGAWISDSSAPGMRATRASSGLIMLSVLNSRVLASPQRTVWAPIETNHSSSNTGT